jgi:hypothetical protein
MSGRGLSITFEKSTDFRPVERALQGVSDRLKNLDKRSPVAQSISREAKRIERSNRRKEQNKHGI